MPASKKSTYIVVNHRIEEDHPNPTLVCFWPTTGDKTQHTTYNKQVAYKLKNLLQEQFPKTPYEVYKIEKI